ncbi:transcription-repair coupling factor [Candidatus Nitrosoglobus terrae]|uniref:Transcription-repair-coupling factor n=1 Tax=Candidatus Nitrosoglobus terrae TaxID=1630141 RepID=A0A1Q2SMM7_9GAMM|nr:transcription-repair coupling factor [Candidatus Nitrosoglobus terrae]BAW80398.1 transcription-repair coupling factor [Candidatus Nitrosoglobus terrae]
MLSILNPSFSCTPYKPGDHHHFGQLYGSSFGLILAIYAHRYPGLILAITPDTATANQLEYELKFYSDKKKSLPILRFPDWETLPYDVFSPHQDIISERLAVLYQLPRLSQGVLIAPVTTLMQRLPPQEYIESHSLMIAVRDQLEPETWRKQVEIGGYRCVSQVIDHGEFAIRGSIIDIFPMGSKIPYRIDLLDNEIDSLRSFDPESQRSLQSIEQIQLLPAREFPFTKEAIDRFRKNHRCLFVGNPQHSLIYREVSEGNTPPGIEYYTPLFFDHTDTLFNYLPENTLIFTSEKIQVAADKFWQQIGDRYEQYCHNLERPLLKPQDLYLQTGEIFTAIKKIPRISLQSPALDKKLNYHNFATQPPSSLILNPRALQPLGSLIQFIENFQGRILFVAETVGRRESLLDLLMGIEVCPRPFESWQTFLESQEYLGITVSPLQQGLLLTNPSIAVIAESQLFGEQAMQYRRRKQDNHTHTADTLIRNLVELTVGAPVVHEEHGVGRYLGLQMLTVGKDTEFMALEYAGGDKLYVPISSLNLISRYTGASPESAPLHKLGSGYWERAQRKAKEQIHDVAAELLAIYAQRAARKKIPLPAPDSHYAIFASAFPFEETPDQTKAIEAVIADLTSDNPMDRLICGDVGFGKTEVAMRAAFIVSQSGKQVAVLVPTTLLAQQHYQSFKDRFADWPVQIEVISRFRSRKEQDAIITHITSGKVDIIIGTHKLLQSNIVFKDLGLMIIDEEHRFGVRQKERMKTLRAEVDVLTLTATPIPRTLHFSLSGLRDLSIIATPPARRLAIKTFVQEWDDNTLREAILREIKRGGQIYFLHNEVESIDKITQKVQSLLPEAKISIAHGQMRERELEQAMLNFYHGRFNILICTTIIETGIDIPNANTIIIHRADKLGLAQLYQLRGRVGRSHHRAYAYLIVPPRSALAADALKRLEAIESIEELGTGFILATHDMEIRGAGELLGKDQSGQMQEIGFNLYHELLERAVNSLKSGGTLDLERSSGESSLEIDLHAPALIPENYIPDTHTRLVLYKRISAAKDTEGLDEIQVEMIDRFGLLPESIKTLLTINKIRLKANKMGIRKIEAGDKGGRIHFQPEPNINPITVIDLIQNQPNTYKLEGSEKLRFIQELPNVQARLKALENLLSILSGHKQQANLNNLKKFESFSIAG